MTPNLLKYSNGWGHVIISVVSLAVAVFLLLQHDPTMNGLAVGIITSVQGYWFVTSAANSIAARAAAGQIPAGPAPTSTTTGGNTNGVA